MSENTTSAFLQRAQSFLMDRAYPWWRNIICKLEEGAQRNAVALLLSGILLKLTELNETSAQGGVYWRCTPFKLTANDEPVRILDIETQGRVREVSVWMDSAILGPPPTIRLSAGASGGGGGILIGPGAPNELGKVPANTTLYMSSDTDISGYIIERA